MKCIASCDHQGFNFRPNCFNEFKNGLQAWDLWVSHRVLNLVDPLLGKVPEHLAMRYVNIGLLCVQESADDRPTMSDVVSMLNNESMILLS